MQTKHTTTKTAGCSQPGNNTELTNAWIAFACRASTDQKHDQLAEALDKRLRKIMPDGSWRQQREGEIRNNTNLFLLKSFLRGNRELAKATSRGDAKRINEELERSIHAAVKIQKKRINREIQKDLDRLTEFDEFRTPVFAPCHPSLAKGLRDLPPSLQSEHLLGAISDSLARQEINNDTAELIREMTDEGMTPARAARIHQVSRNAMRQRLRRAAKSINRSLEKRELSDLR